MQFPVAVTYVWQPLQLYGGLGVDPGSLNFLFILCEKTAKGKLQDRSTCLPVERAVEHSSGVLFKALTYEVHFSLYRMHEMIAVSVCQSLSLGFAVQKRLSGSISCFGVNTHGDQGTSCYTGGPDPLQRERGVVGGNFVHAGLDPLHVSRTAEVRDLKFCANRGLRGQTKKTMQK